MTFGHDIGGLSNRSVIETGSGMIRINDDFFTILSSNQKSSVGQIFDDHVRPPPFKNNQF
jgi:hypothetical protein